MSEDNYNRLSVNLKKDLKRELDIYCAEVQQTQKDVIEKIISDFLKKRGKSK